MDALIAAGWVALLAVTVWVYVDARGRDWSRTGYRRWSPRFWAVMTFFMAIVMVPFYLVVRRRAHPKRLKRCRACAEFVQRDATVCRFCGRAP